MRLGLLILLVSIVVNVALSAAPTPLRGALKDSGNGSSSSAVASPNKAPAERSNGVSSSSTSTTSTTRKPVSKMAPADRPEHASSFSARAVDEESSPGTTTEDKGNEGVTEESGKNDGQTDASQDSDKVSSGEQVDGEHKNDQSGDHQESNGVTTDGEHSSEQGGGQDNVTQQPSQSAPGGVDSVPGSSDPSTGTTEDGKGPGAQQPGKEEDGTTDNNVQGGAGTPGAGGSPGQSGSENPSGPSQGSGGGEDGKEDGSAQEKPGGSTGDSQGPSTPPSTPGEPGSGDTVDGPSSGTGGNDQDATQPTVSTGGSDAGDESEEPENPIEKCGTTFSIWFDNGTPVATLECGPFTAVYAPVNGNPDPAPKYVTGPVKEVTVEDGVVKIDGKDVTTLSTDPKTPTTGPSTTGGASKPAVTLKKRRLLALSENSEEGSSDTSGATSSTTASVTDLFSFRIRGGKVIAVGVPAVNDDAKRTKYGLSSDGVTFYEGDSDGGVFKLNGDGDLEDPTGKVVLKGSSSSAYGARYMVPSVIAVFIALMML